VGGKNNGRVSQVEDANRFLCLARSERTIALAGHKKRKQYEVDDL